MSKSIPSWATEVVRFEHKTRPKAGEYFVAVTVGMADGECNMNVPNGNFSNEIGDAFKNDDVNNNGVNSIFGNPGAKVGMPVGFRACQFLTGPKGAFISAVVYKDKLLRLPNERPLIFPNIYPTQFVCDTLVMGVSDRSTKSDEQKPDGDSRQIRESVRTKLFAGESFDYGVHGMKITQVGPKSLNEILAEPGVIDSRTGMPGKRHFFIVVGRVPNLKSMSLMTRGNANQYRVFCDELTIYEVSNEAVAKGEVFGDTTRYMFLAGNGLDLFVNKNVVPTLAPTAVVAEPAAAAVVAEVVEPEVVIPGLDVPQLPIDADYVSRLEKYYDKTSLKAFSAPAENALSAQEVVNSFDIVHYPELNALARKRMRIGEAARNRASVNVADAVRYYFVSHLTNNTFEGEREALNLGDYPWNVEHAQDVINIMNGVGKLNNMTGLPQLLQTEEGWIVNFGEEVGFKIIDGFVYDQRGRMLMSVLEMVIKEEIVRGKREISLAGVQYVSSMTAFMRLIYFGYLPLLVQSYTDTLTSISTNMAMFVNDEYVTQHLVRFSQDSVVNQNAAALHRIRSEHGVLVHAKINPLEGHNWKTWPAEEGQGRFAKNITYYYRGKTKNYNVREFWPALIDYAQSVYCLDYSFSKKVFVNGYLGHVRLDLVEALMPETYKLLQEAHGLSKEDIVCATTKAAKGFKRISLALAQSADVFDAQYAGWQLYRQQEPLQGSLQPVALLPTLVLPPGVSLWVGPAEERPIGLLDKTFKSYKINVAEDARPIFSMGCVLQEDDYEYSTVTNVEGTWTQATPKAETFIGRGENDWGDLTLAQVDMGKFKGYVNHESVYQGRLNWIRWRVRKNMQLQNVIHELDIVWSVTTAENWPKVRSIAKAMLAGADRSCINLPASRRCNIIHAQDGIKADTLYAWLMVIGNTLRYNWENPVVAEMRAEAERINAMLGHPGYQGVVIELITLASCHYDRLQELFAQIFGQTVGVYLKNMGDTGRLLYEMHQCDDYQLLPVDKFGEHAYIRKGEDPADPKTNITRFVFVNGAVSEVHQRCYGFASVKGCTLYNVELFESSTVMEAVTESCLVPNASRAMTYTGSKQDFNVLQDLSMEFMDTMIPNLFKLKAMFQMSQSGTFGCKNVVVINELNGMFKFKPADRTFVYERLSDLGLKRYSNQQGKMFEVISKAFEDTVFVFMFRNQDSFSVYLPALRKFNKLSSSNESTETLSSVFFENTFKPMMASANAGVPRAVISSVRGKLRSMITSEETRKLLKGRNKLAGRRVGLPCVPVSETWILYSEQADSLYNRYKRYLRSLGVKLDLTRTEVGYNGRDPMIAGWFSKLRVVTPEELEALGWQMGPHTFGVSPVAIYIDGGDFDGDNHTFVYVGDKAHEEVMTYERAIEIRNNAMGADMLRTGGYAFDHYTRKSFAAATKSLSSKAVRTATRSLNEYINYNIGAHEVQNIAVGQCYKVCMIGENIVQLVKDLHRQGLSVPARFVWASKSNANDVILATTEIYEIMLGGYSYEANKLYHTCLKPAIQEGASFSSYLTTERHHEELRGILKDYGANISIYDEFLQVLDAVALTQHIQLKGRFPQELVTQPLDLFVICAALCSFELTRGRFQGFKGAIANFRPGIPASEGHYSALQFVYEFLGNSMLGYEGYIPYLSFVKNSHVLVSLTRMLNQLDAELGLVRPSNWPRKPQNSAAFLKSFLDEEIEDDNNDDDGNVTTPVKPSNPEGPMTAAIETVKTEEAPAPTTAYENPLFAGLTEGQKKAFNAVLAGHNVVISGEAGVGKSHLTQKIRAVFKAKGWDVVTMGSTGVSVINIEGDGTFNSKLGLGLGFGKHGRTGDQATRIMSNARATPAFRNTVTPSKDSLGMLFIVDEVSMTDTKLLFSGAKVVEDSGVKVQWLLVGDPGQCSPVDGELFFKDFKLNYATGDKEYDSFIKTGNFHCFALNEVVRQADDHEFLTALQSLRRGGDMHPVILNRFKASTQQMPEEAIHAFFNNECVKNYNNERAAEMIAAGAKSKVYKANIRRLKIANDEVYARFLKWFDPIEENMTLCIDMPVMVRKNIKDDAGQLVAANGTVGRITKLGSNYVEIKLPNGDLLPIEYVDLEGPRNSRGEALGSFKQLPLHPAFALTGHKLQGLTIRQPLVVHAYQKRWGNKVPVSTTGWLYVVCSRVTTSEHLYFDTSDAAAFPNLLGSVCVDKEALEWVNKISEEQN